MYLKSINVIGSILHKFSYLLHAILEGCARCVIARVPCQYTIRVNYTNSPDYIRIPSFLEKITGKFEQAYENLCFILIKRMFAGRVCLIGWFNFNLAC